MLHPWELKALAVFSPDAGCENSSLSLLLITIYLQTKRHQVKVPLGIDVPCDTGCGRSGHISECFSCNSSLLFVSISYTWLLAHCGFALVSLAPTNRARIPPVTLSVLVTVVFFPGVAMQVGGRESLLPILLWICFDK